MNSGKKQNAVGLDNLDRMENLDKSSFSKLRGK